MEWEKKKTAILRIYLCLQKEVGKTNILIRKLFLKDLKCI
jgi:hypothetical protein